MLNHTFCHLPGIGQATEKKLWQAGVCRWEQWRDPAPVRLPNSGRAELLGLLADSAQALPDDPAFFTSRLANSDVWRIFPHYRERTAYLDIETTGLGEGAEITTIALYDGSEVRCYVNGDNLDQFLDDVMAYQVLVTYNGKSFDIPFIERHFQAELNQAQIDLRYVLARLGCRGGLKGCEKMLGINRGSLEGVDGYFAVLLWYEYQNSWDPAALETLLAYNIEDTVNLERLLVEAYNRNVAATPFAEELQLPWPEPPPLPFQPDLALVDRLRRRHHL